MIGDFFFYDKKMKMKTITILRLNDLSKYILKDQKLAWMQDLVVASKNKGRVKAMIELMKNMNDKKKQFLGGLFNVLSSGLMQVHHDDMCSFLQIAQVINDKREIISALKNVVEAWDECDFEEKICMWFCEDLANVSFFSF